MGKCLVTKLNGSISNSDILRIGEMRVHYNKVSVPSDKTQGFNIGVTNPVVLEIIGEGYFTDKTLTENKGKTLTLNAGTNNIWVSNNELEVAILNKYDLTTVTGTYTETGIGTENKSLNIEDFKYSKSLTSIFLSYTKASGDIASLKNLTALNYLQCYNTQVSGDIASLKNLTALKIISLNNTQVSGDIASLKNLTALTYFTISNTQVSGDIASLKNLTALISIDLVNVKVSGDIGELATLTNLQSLSIINTASPVTGNVGKLSTLTKIKEMVLKYGKFTGDIATLADTCRYISFQNNIGTTITWSTRPSSAKIIAIEGNAKLDNVDKMLQDQAQCQVGFASGDDIYYKKISVTGTRTSASDSAVQALQQKGYTVTINPA